ncbi:hypothetical protein [Sinomonas sp. R1AF57]|uniref:hypothetical protein n=1 Tax=Sinomonas sp. R1AF57 TaxID=2020377 RepID=UPI000B5E0B4D|nr:hypothetical protein [Sinomonas sp. R1AF57]ASN51348.1 hypothetical protein CGQ25_04025 [Sinomonas sp. R1AF57]
MPYTADAHRQPPSRDELRARIPGWGADLDPKDRPSVPREQRLETGAHWDFPERQAETTPHEHSLEHRFVTPVFGTSVPLRGVSGAIRRFAYRRYSEGQTAHWLLLIAGDRVDAWESHARSLFSGAPDNPVTETGILGEAGHHPVASRFGRGRADVRHQWIDPIIVAGPWIAAPVVAVLAARKTLRAFRGA